MEAGVEVTQRHCCSKLQQTAAMPDHICQFDEMMFGDDPITTDELCCTLSVSKDSVLETIEEPGCSRVCGLGCHRC
jgi:hypothetical protein